MTTDEAIEVTGREVVSVNGTVKAGLPTLRTEADVDAFVQQSVMQWNAYIRLTEDLLDESDYQKIGQRKFKKKSAWRKYARAFNISCEKLSEEIARSEDGYPIFARIVVRASTPDGRFQDGDQECHVNERCCAIPCTKRSWKGHTCCKLDCSGRQHFSHPGDIVATAFTRAKNRAITDLIGAGEVSAEEMKDEPSEAPATTPREAPQRRSAPATAEKAPDPTSKLWAMLYKIYDRGTQRGELLDFVEAKYPDVVDGEGDRRMVDFKRLDAAEVKAFAEELEAIAAIK